MRKTIFILAMLFPALFCSVIAFYVDKGRSQNFQDGIAFSEERLQDSIIAHKVVRIGKLIIAPDRHSSRVFPTATVSLLPFEPEQAPKLEIAGAGAEGWQR